MRIAILRITSVFLTVSFAIIALLSAVGAANASSLRLIAAVSGDNFQSGDPIYFSFQLVNMSRSGIQLSAVDNASITAIVEDLTNGLINECDSSSAAASASVGTQTTLKEIRQPSQGSYSLNLQTCNLKVGGRYYRAFFLLKQDRTNREPRSYDYIESNAVDFSIRPDPTRESIPDLQVSADQVDFSSPHFSAMIAGSEFEDTALIPVSFQFVNIGKTPIIVAHSVEHRITLVIENLDEGTTAVCNRQGPIVGPVSPIAGGGPDTMASRAALRRPPDGFYYLDYWSCSPTHPARYEAFFLYRELWPGHTNPALNEYVQSNRVEFSIIRKANVSPVPKASPVQPN